MPMIQIIAIAADIFTPLISPMPLMPLLLMLILEIFFNIY